MSKKSSSTNNGDITLHDVINHMSGMEQRLSADIQKNAEGISELRSYVDQRFEQVDRRFEQVDQRLDKVDRRLERLYEADDQILVLCANNFKDHNKRLIKLEAVGKAT